ncbi:MAG: aminotransferase class I/II-fold pyridoxal phosphate-dependent enzyme [Streptosporangiaceae bacterium]
MNSETVAARHEQARQDYEALKGRGLKLDLTRGKPSPDQLDLANGLLTLPGEGVYRSADGTDLRNYGGLTGILELRELFSRALQVPVAQLLALGNASLAVMHDTVVHALLSVVPGGERRWVEEPRVAFLCPVPGYDRHFSLCERFGIELIPVPMTEDGPDLDVVERLVAEDSGIKGIWCVPKYSNPTGVSYSDEVVRRLASMTTAAPDFRIFWDNAYAVHHLTDKPVEIADVLEACAAAGNPDRVFVFGSTSKITHAGTGVAFFGSSPVNVAWYLRHLSMSTIGPDKINQLRHIAFLKDEAGLAEHMSAHAALLRPKFEAVDRILTEELGDTDLATWTKPAGGYFVSLDVPDGCAKRVGQLAKEAGIALTPAGATHPYGNDPQDRTIRIAPTFPVLAELELAIAGLATCVRLAGYEKQLG